MQNFDPSILLGASNPQFINSGIAGFQAGQGMAEKIAKQRQQRALMEAGGMVGNVDPALAHALQNNPEIAKQYFTQQMVSKLKIKNALPDNEWIDDPADANYQIYVEKVTDPDTRMPIMRPVPGMRKKKPLIERIDWEKKKLASEENRFDRNFNEEKRQFNLKNTLDNEANQLAWASHKIDKAKADLEIGKKRFELRQKEAGAEIDYSNLKRKAEDAMGVIDRMIGSEDGTIKQHPGFKGTVGLKGGSLMFGLRREPFQGTKEADFMTLYKKVTGQAFMEAFQGLKGGGQITEVEGQKATEALIEMNTAQSETAFIDAARRFQHYVRTGMELAKKEKQQTLGEPFIPLSGSEQQMTDEEIINKVLGQ